MRTHDLLNLTGVIAALVLGLGSLAVPSTAQILGPSPYLGAADSPFDGLSFTYFHLADMEADTLGAPGVAASVGGPIGPGSITDSVDEDDGALDGSGTGGWSFFSGNGPGGITFTFDEGALGRLPTHVGIVWTDGVDSVGFEAFDTGGVSLGSVRAGHADGNHAGGTEEDRFYGVIHLDGVKSIFIACGLPANGGGIEVDHLQFGAAGEVPEEGSRFACTRGPGFWKQQCAQKGNGSTKFTEDEVAQIAACIDERSTFFDWSVEGALSGFCYAIDPPNPKDQLQRHYATLLANVCAGHLDLVANNGSHVRLDEDVEIACGDFSAGTVGALIDEIDGVLDGSDTATTTTHQQIRDCIGAVLDGSAIVLADACGNEDDNDNNEETLLRLARPYPNPLQGSTTVLYTVRSEDRVELAVYSVSGRLVTTLEDRMRAPGEYEASWDGRDASGRPVTSGIYFIKAKVGGRAADAKRVLVLPR